MEQAQPDYAQPDTLRRAAMLALSAVLGAVLVSQLLATYHAHPLWHMVSTPWYLLRMVPLLALSRCITKGSGGLGVTSGYAAAMAFCTFWVDPTLALASGLPAIGTSSGNQALVALSLLSVLVSASPGSLQGVVDHPEGYLWRACAVAALVALLVIVPHVVRVMAVVFLLVGGA